jgi:hypothetical protein
MERRDGESKTETDDLVGEDQELVSFRMSKEG